MTVSPKSSPPHPGSTYTVSFWLADNGPLNVFQQLSTNGNVTGTGGNGIDLLVYAGAIPTITVPEPATCATRHGPRRDGIRAAPQIEVTYRVFEQQPRPCGGALFCTSPATAHRCGRLPR